MFNAKNTKFVNRTYSELLNQRSSIISKLESEYTVVFIYPRLTFINLGNLFNPVPFIQSILNTFKIKNIQIVNTLLKKSIHF